MGAAAAVGWGLRAYLRRRIKRLSDDAHWARSARQIQTGTLRSLLQRAAATEVGRERGFACLAERPDDADLLAAYRDAVAPADYEAWRPFMTRMREHAEPDVTWPGVVRDWAQTSGTTGGEKYIPVSREMMRSNYRAGLDIFAHAARWGLPLGGLFGGKILFLGGCTDLTVNEHGVRTGDLSGLVTPMIRFPLDRVYLPGAEVALMSDWPKKIAAMSELCERADVRGVSGMASWSLALFEDVLRRSRRRGGPAALRELWPNFRLFIHGGVRYNPFEPRVREAWSGPGGDEDVPCRLEVYPASEGFIAVQDRRGDPGLRLHTDIGVCYEFLPLSEFPPDGDPTLASAKLCDEVEPGERYVVCMTTCAGLWRYVIGDVVEFDTIPPDGPPRLRIVGRHRHFVNAFGENLIVEEIERAVEAAQAATGARAGEFTAAPVYPGEGGPGLELVCEFPGLGGAASGSADARLPRFAEVFDQSLRALNVDYNTKRSGDFGMKPAAVTPVPVGSFHAWMASRGKLGGQNKCPRCANHRDFASGVVARAGAGVS